MAASKEAVIAKIREHYAALDIPLDGLSDLDVEVGVRQLAAAAKEMGSSPDDVNKAMREAVKAVEEAAREREAAAAAAAAEAGEDGQAAKEGNAGAEVAAGEDAGDADPTPTTEKPTTK